MQQHSATLDTIGKEVLVGCKALSNLIVRHFSLGTIKVAHYNILSLRILSREREREHIARVSVSRTEECVA